MDGNLALTLGLEINDWIFESFERDFSGFTPFLIGRDCRLTASAFGFARHRVCRSATPLV